jgi:RNase P subunit RPR2
MVDLKSIQGAISNLEAANELANTSIRLRDIATLHAKTIALRKVILRAQSSALRAQSEQSTLLERIRQLEETIAEVQAWNAEKQKYRLTEINPGQFAYTLKGHTGSTEPQHMLCANCYNHNEKSILQTEIRYAGKRTVYFCQNCGSDMFFNRTSGQKGTFRPPRLIKRPRNDE